MKPHLLMNRGCFAQIDRSTVSFNCIHRVCNKRFNKGRKKKKPWCTYDTYIFHIKNTMLFFFSNNCTLLLKNCTCNLFCQQLGNKEIMRMYLYLFENGCICVCMYIYMFTYYMYFEILKTDNFLSSSKRDTYTQKDSIYILSFCVYVPKR